MEAERPTLRIESSGPRPLVVKTAGDGVARRRLNHELTVLRRVQHPGVVTLVDTTGEAHDGGEELIVRTRLCGSRNLGTVGDLTVDRTAGTLASLSTTIADLHEMGVAHRRVSTDHVLLAGDGRPVLCGFGEAALDASADDRAADVAALGCLLRDLIVDGDELVPLPGQARGGRRGWSGYQRRALLNLADLATADDPARRPSARQFAHQLRSAVPDASLTDGTGDTGPEPHDDRHRRGAAMPRLAAIATAAAVVVTVVGMGLARALPSGGNGAESAPATTEMIDQAIDDDPADSPVAGDRAASPVDPSPPPNQTETSDHLWEEVTGCSTSVGGATTRRDGTDCPGSLALESGVLTVGEEVFELDVGDAIAAVGRFSCGEPRAAVLDLTSGGIFIFTEWASTDAPTTAERAAHLLGARRLVVEPSDGQRCDRLVALDEYGIRHTIDIPSRGEP